MKTVLQFSGGKDSLACLYLNTEHWHDDDFYVMWCNTGAAYQETIDLMDRWRHLVRNFVEVKSDQPGNIKRFGYPSDIVPMSYTWMAGKLGYNRPFMLQAGLACCSANLWEPLVQAVKDLNAAVVIRGQRDDEPNGAPIIDGSVVEGITYRLPLQHWTKAQVFEYLREVGADIPEYYPNEPTSRDCWNCTAYLNESTHRIEKLPYDRRIEVLGRLSRIGGAIDSESIYRKELLRGYDHEL